MQKSKKIIVTCFAFLMFIGMFVMSGETSIQAKSQFFLVNYLGQSEMYSTGPTVVSSQDGNTYHTVHVNMSDGAQRDVVLSNYHLRDADDPTNPANDTLAFCIEPMTDTTGGLEYDPYGGDLNAILSNAERHQLQKISFFGFGYQGDYSQLAYAATQVAIWEVRGASVSNISSDLRNQVQVINNRISTYDTSARPSFINEKIVLKGYGKENGTTLTDTNNVLSTWFQKNVSGNYKVEKSGNQLTIYAENGTSLNQGTISLHKIDPTISSTRGVDIIYTNPNDAQKLMKISGLDFDGLEMSVRLANGTASINKRDITTKDEIIGAQLQIVDKDNNAVVDSWISNETEHDIILPAGDYTLNEVFAPNGYVNAQDVDFSIRTDGEIVPIEMLDDYTKVQIQKYEGFLEKPTTTNVVDATIEVIEKDSGIVVTSFETSNEIKQLDRLLVVGKEYVLRETKTPYGFKTAADITFTVKNTGDIQYVSMYDEVITKNVKIKKVDAGSKKIITEQAKFTVYSDEACTNEVANATTLDGFADFQLRYGDYYLKELHAPSGYQLSKEIIHIRIDDTTSDKQTIIFENSELSAPSTKDPTTLRDYQILAILSIGIIGYYFMRRNDRLN